MSEYQEFTGKTVEEALKAARDVFGVTSLDDMDFEILTPGSRGVLGMGAEPARIIAAARSALGGAAPRREAAAAEAPPPPARPRRDHETRDDVDRGRRRERGGRHDHTERPAPASAAAASVAPEPAAPTGPADQPQAAGGRYDRAGRSDRGERGHRREGGRTGTGLSVQEQEQLAAARAPLSVEREELQASEATPEALAAGKEILETILEHLGFAASVTVHAGETSKINVTADGAEKEALGALIGRKGERLSALQHIVNLLLSKRMGTWTRVLVDVEDYRGRRERQLREIALRAADRVEETGKMLQLEAMPALERRWIHLALRDRSGIRTQSIGEEPNRRVVIIRTEA
jgi:spoIIIJ-associated protein